MSQDWDEIISFYHDLESSDGWYFVSMEALVRRIVEHRDVSHIYPVTSHETLSLSRYKTYDEWLGKPSVSIRPASAENYWFRLIEPLEDGEVYRERSESISCRMEYTLAAFDEVIEKLGRLESVKSREA